MNVSRGLPSLCAGLRHISLTGAELAAKAPIKRPSNAYFLFREANYKALSKQNPHLTVAALATKLGEQWRSLPSVQKETFEAAAGVQREQYRKEMARLSESELEDLKREARDKRVAKRVRQLKAELRALKVDAPARPGGPLAIYFAENFDRKSAGTAAEKMKKIAEAYKVLSPGQKAVYEDKAKAGSEGYDQKRKEWQNIIKQDGRKEKIQALNVELNSLKKQIM